MYNDIIKNSTQNYIRQIDISEYPKGIYIIKIKSNSIFKTVKFMIQ